jgi:uncharacterized protein (UPF0335 family)
MTASLRSFIDRVLRLKEEQDSLSSDIKEIYAEAKANGFDKTVMGQLVAYLRKREKDQHKLEENTAIFELYLHEYDRGTDVAIAHAHEGDPPHDPSTGEIIEPSSVPSDDEAGQGALRGQGTSVAPPTVSDAQHEATVETTPPMPAATRPASSQGPCPHGSGEVQDRCESTSPTHSTRRNEGEGKSALPDGCGAQIQQAGPNDGGDNVTAPKDLRTSARDTVDFSAEPSGADTGSAVQFGAPHSEPVTAPPIPVTVAAIERSPSPDNALAATFPDLPAQFDRRSRAA